MQGKTEEKSGKIREGNKHLKSTLVECAWSATKTKDTYFNAKYHSLITRRGAKRALVAIAHKIIFAVYHILKKKEAYKELGFTYLESRRKKKQADSYIKRLLDLGIRVEIIQQE